MARVCSWSVRALSELEKKSQESQEIRKWQERIQSGLEFRTLHPQGLQIDFREGLFEAVSEEHILLRIDLLEDRRNYHRKNLKGKKDLLLRSLGFEMKGQRLVDLTCGLGRDTVYMSQQGFHVFAFERDPLLAFLFQSSLLLQAPVFSSNIDFSWADTMAEGFSFPEVETAYFDPMFPQSRGTAKPKKEMEFLRHHLGSPVDMDLEEKFVGRLLDQKIFRRIVVKVHPSRDFKIGREPNHIYKGESVVYHSYLSRSSS